MKLSDAIRQGAAIRPQAFGAYAARLPDGTLGTCAIGAAYEAITGHPPTPDEATPAQIEAVVGTATGLRFPRMMFWALRRQNDVDRLTREEIADQLAAGGL